MKNLSLVLVLFAITSQSFAGELINRKTQESLAFTLKSGSVQIESRAIDFPSTEIKLVTIKQEDLKFKTPLMPITSKMFEAGEESEGGLGLMYSIFLPFTVAAHVIDVIALPLRLPFRIIKVSKHKKDFITLRGVIITDKKIEVTNARFNRILDVLRNQQSE